MKERYKKITLVILMLSLVFTLSACGDKNSPEDTVNSLFDSVKELDFEEMETLVVDSEKENLEEEAEGFTNDLVEKEKIEEINFDEVKGFDDAKSNLKEILSDLDYKIIDTKETEDTATVTVEAEYVDGEPLVSDFIQDLFGEIMGQALAGEEELSDEDSMSLLVEVFNKNYAVFEKSLKADTVDIQLIKDDEGDWLISELEEDLINILAFNMVEGMDNVFSGMMDGFEE